MALEGDLANILVFCRCGWQGGLVIDRQAAYAASEAHRPDCPYGVAGSPPESAADTLVAAWGRSILQGMRPPAPAPVMGLDSACTCAREYGRHAWFCPSFRSAYGSVSPEMEAARRVAQSANEDRRKMEEALAIVNSQRDHAIAAKQKADQALAAAVQAHRGQIDMTREERERAERAEDILHDAWPMLADLVPKYPEARELCARILAALTPKAHPDLLTVLAETDIDGMVVPLLVGDAAAPPKQ